MSGILSRLAARAMGTADSVRSVTRLSYAPIPIVNDVGITGTPSSMVEDPARRVELQPSMVEDPARRVELQPSMVEDPARRVELQHNTRPIERGRDEPRNVDIGKSIATQHRSNQESIREAAPDSFNATERVVGPTRVTVSVDSHTKPLIAPLPAVNETPPASKTRHSVTQDLPLLADKNQKQNLRREEGSAVPGNELISDNAPDAIHVTLHHVQDRELLDKKLPFVEPLLPTQHSTRVGFNKVAGLAPYPRSAALPEVAPDDVSEVHVTIGRIEVTAVHEAPPPKRKTPAGTKPMTLDDYLARRRRST